MTNATDTNPTTTVNLILGQGEQYERRYTGTVIRATKTLFLVEAQGENGDTRQIWFNRKTGRAVRADIYTMRDWKMIVG